MSFFRKKLGADGERLAGRYLRRLGYRPVAKNYTCPVGEIDLICRDDDCIVFVEVKSRSEDDAGDPEDSITAGKRRQIERAARWWLEKHGHPEAAYRFDAVSVVFGTGEPQVRHAVEAFHPTGL